MRLTSKTIKYSAGRGASARLTSDGKGVYYLSLEQSERERE